MRGGRSWQARPGRTDNTIAAWTALGIDSTMKCPPFLTVQEMEALPEEGKEARLIHQVMQLQKFIIQSQLSQSYYKLSLIHI